MKGIKTRLARVVVPGYPHHVTERDNRRQTTFFENDDYRLSLSLLKERCEKSNLDIWAYCLMLNPLHLTAIPETAEGLRRGIGEAHRHYTRAIHSRMEWCGFLWQGRFASLPMDESSLLAAGRYVELNPVKAQLVQNPEDEPWSSARFYMNLSDDTVVRSALLKDMVGDWRAFLMTSDDAQLQQKTQYASRMARPLVSEAFVSGLGTRLERQLHP